MKFPGATHLVILAKSRKAAERAFQLSEETPASLRLRLNESKTRVVRFSDAFRFLGVIFLKDLLLQPWKPGRQRLKVLSVRSAPCRRPSSQRTNGVRCASTGASDGRYLCTRAGLDYP